MSFGLFSTRVQVEEEIEDTSDSVKLEKQKVRGAHKYPAVCNV